MEAPDPEPALTVLIAVNRLLVRASGALMPIDAASACSPDKLHGS